MAPPLYAAHRARAQMEMKKKVAKSQKWIGNQGKRNKEEEEHLQVKIRRCMGTCADGTDLLSKARPPVLAS